MQKQTQQWLKHFVTVFGSKGLVALAWWAGAFHAERIRKLQTAYPILHLTGDVGAGCSTLLENLWKLAGIPHHQGMALGFGTSKGMARYLRGAVNQPAVMEAIDGHGESEFDRFPPCYEGSNVLFQSGSSYERVKFQGALVLVGGGDAVRNSKLLSSRVVHIHLSDTTRTAARYTAAKQLEALTASDVTDFLNRVRNAGDQVAFRLGHTQAYIESLREDVGASIGLREARNHAQIRCLLDLLYVLGLLPGNTVTAAHAEVCDMAWWHQELPF